MWRVLFGGLLGFGVAKLLEEDKPKTKSSQRTGMDDVPILTWREMIANAINYEGIEYAMDGYSDWEEVKDKRFQKARKEYLSAKKDLENYVNKKMTGSEQESVLLSIGDEPFDFVMSDDYSDWKEYYDFGAGETKTMKDKGFQIERKKYLKAEKNLYDSLGLIED